MSSIFFIIFVSVIAIGTILGIAYILDKRGKQSKSANPALLKLGPIGIVLIWVARTSVVLMILSIIGAFVFRSLPLISFAGSCLGLYILDGIIYRVIRSTGK
jgi:hypothetical protein